MNGQPGQLLGVGLGVGRKRPSLMGLDRPLNGAPRQRRRPNLVQLTTGTTRLIEAP
jgi:hypothetical protein